jgi:hypothetical protein
VPGRSPDEIRIQVHQLLAEPARIDGQVPHVVADDVRGPRLDHERLHHPARRLGMCAGRQREQRQRELETAKHHDCQGAGRFSL